MIDGHFYFVKDAFYQSLPNCNLMENKGNDVGKRVAGLVITVLDTKIIIG